jgi:hypothetical protein
MSRRSGGGLARLITRHRGRKGVKDAALAKECGFTVDEMYRRLGSKLLMIPRSGWFAMEPDQPDNDQELALPIIVFTKNGVIAVTAWLDTDRSREVGLRLVHLLSTRRRASKNKSRRPRRAHDPARQAKFQRADAPLRVAWRKLRIRIHTELVSARTDPALLGSPARSRNRKSRVP